MSFTSSPGSEVTDLMRRRNLASIPKDQQSLLERPDSWAVDLKHHPHGLAHVPGHVLETVKAAYVARQEADKAPSASPYRRSLSASTPNGRQTNGRPTVQNVQSQVLQSSPETPIPWSPSPERVQPRRQVAMESPIVRETPKALPKSTPKITPMAPPPRPVPVSRPPADIEYPSSGPEEDLEMELPQAQEKHDAPVNRAALHLQATAGSPPSSGRRPMDTPPCAQGTQSTQTVVPNTVVQEPVVEEGAAPKRGRKRMKEIHFSDETPRKIRPAMNRLAPTKIFEEIVSSNTTSSSSVIPATVPTQGSVLNSIEDANHNMVQDRPRRADDLGITPGPIPRQTPSSQPYIRATPITPQPTTPILPSEDMRPFEAFTRAYPTYTEQYSGTLWDFIKACVCLDWLRKRRLLRECLYDDFIRAFADGYQTYVRNAGPGQEALVAIEWFNNLPGRSVFNRMVVNKENIGYILDSYPKEVVKASRLIVQDTQSEADLIMEQSPPIPIGYGKAKNNFVPRKSIQPNATPEPTEPVEVEVTTVNSVPSTSPKPAFNSTPPASSAPTAITGKKAPRSSQYFERLASSSRAKSVSGRRSVEERARLREHFLKRKSAGSRSASTAL